MKNKNKQTKFPVARIKRIMQKDEEVGKVAQATPVVISKALELFLAMIVDEASKVTIDRGSKKVEAYHLKHAIETVDMLDFLKEIVEAVPDPSAGGTVDLNDPTSEDGQKKKRSRAKKAAGVEGEENEAPAAPVRKRKKKAEGGEVKERKPRGKKKAAGAGPGLVEPEPEQQMQEEEMDRDDYDGENGGRAGRDDDEDEDGWDR